MLQTANQIIKSNWQKRAENKKPVISHENRELSRSGTRSTPCLPTSVLSTVSPCQQMMPLSTLQASAAGEYLNWGLPLLRCPHPVKFSHLQRHLHRIPQFGKRGPRLLHHLMQSSQAKRNSTKLFRLWTKLFSNRSAHKPRYCTTFCSLSPSPIQA